MRRPAKFPVHYGIATVLRPFVPFQPLPLERIGTQGVPLGITRTGPFYFNPWELAARELIGSPGIVIFGELGIGKTTLAKVIGWWFGSLKTQPNNPDAPWMNVWADDSHAGEYADLAGWFGCEPLAVAHSSFNPLDSSMDIDDQLVIVCQLIIMADGFPITPAERNILISGLSKLKQANMDVSLHDLVRVLNDSDTLEPALLFVGSDQRVNVDQETFRTDCKRMTMRLSNMLHGPFGRVFGHGTDRSVLEKLQQRVVNIDFDGASDDVKRVVQMLFWMMKKKNMFDINIHDEMHELLRLQEFTRPLHDAVKFQRKSSKATVLITHTINDYRSVPGEAGDLAWSVLKHSPIWFVGKLENAEDALAIQEARSLSDKVTNWILNLKPKEFVAIIGSEIEPFRFRVFRPSAMEAMTFSNQALANRVGRRVR